MEKYLEGADHRDLTISDEIIFITSKGICYH